MAVTYAQIVGELLDSRQAEIAAAKNQYESQGLQFNHWNRRDFMLTESQRREVIELSAQGLTPKPIAEQLGLNAKQVSNVRTVWKGAIDARRNELQGRRPDGTPGNPETTHRMTVQSVEIAGEFGQYRLTPERVHILGCEIQLIDCDKLPALIADLTAIDEMVARGAAWKL